MSLGGPGNLAQMGQLVGQEHVLQEAIHEVQEHL